MGKVISHQPHVALGSERSAPSVECNDPAGFLSSVLQGVKAQRCQNGRVFPAENAKHAALMAHPVFLAGVEVILPVPAIEKKRSGQADLPPALLFSRPSRLCPRGTSEEIDHCGQAISDDVGRTIQQGIGLGLGDLGRFLAFAHHLVHKKNEENGGQRAPEHAENGACNAVKRPDLGRRVDEA
jgi:hypothetical protein